jgi:imidazolonepropionase-like amidohydrolase
MQIHELTGKRKLNEVGAWSKGFLKGFGIDVPDQPKSTPELEALAKAPLLVKQSAENMQRQWAEQVSRAMAADAVTDPAQISPQAKFRLKDGLKSIIAHNEFLKGADFEQLDQMVSQVDANGNPTTVYVDQADSIMNRMLAGMQQLNSLNAATPATQELARFQMLAQAAYEAGVLLQFHPGAQAGQASPVAPPPASAAANQPQHGSIRRTRTGQFEINFGAGWVPVDMNNPQHAAYMQALQAGTAP